MNYDAKKCQLVINLHDEEVDKLIEAWLKDAFQGSFDKNVNGQPEDRKYNKKLRKALKRVLQYVSYPGTYDDLEV